MSEREMIEEQSELFFQYENFLTAKGLREDKERGYDYFHPSSFGNCFRKIALQYYGYPKDYETEPKARRIFSAGHAHHDRMQSHFAEMGILRGYWRCMRCGKVHGKDNKIGIFCPRDCDCADKVPEDFEKHKRTKFDLFQYREIQVENKEYHFKGHCDGVIELIKGNDDERYVVDFKTVRSEKFSYLKKPDPVYVTQIRIYMWLLDIKQGIIFYEEKNSHEIKEFRVLQDEHHIEEIKKNAKKLWGVLQSKRIPAIHERYRKDRKPCYYCEYRDRCWAPKEK